MCNFTLVILFFCLSECRQKKTGHTHLFFYFWSFDLWQFSIKSENANFLCKTQIKRARRLQRNLSNIRMKAKCWPTYDNDGITIIIMIMIMVEYFYYCILFFLFNFYWKMCGIFAYKPFCKLMAVMHAFWQLKIDLVFNNLGKIRKFPKWQ